MLRNYDLLTHGPNGLQMPVMALTATLLVSSSITWFTLINRPSGTLMISIREWSRNSFRAIEVNVILFDGGPWSPRVMLTFNKHALGVQVFKDSRKASDHNLYLFDTNVPWDTREPCVIRADTKP